MLPSGHERKSSPQGEDFDMIFYRMQSYRETPHSLYHIKYHIFWFIKYRKRLGRGGLSNERENFYVKIAKRAISSYWRVIFPKIRLMSAYVPLHLLLSKLVQFLNGKSSRKLLLEFKTLSKQFWPRNL